MVAQIANGEAGSSVRTKLNTIISGTAGGTTGQVLKKTSNSDHAYAWATDETGGGGGAPTNASYLVLGNDATLSAERVFTPSGGLTATDAGANGTYTVRLADMAQATFKMRAAGAGTGAPIDGTAAQAKTALAIGVADVSGAAPATASYLVVGNDATLSAERVFTPGGGIAVTDAGANGAYTVRLADMAQATFKMRAAGAGTGAPIDGTAAQAKTALAIAVADVSGAAPTDGPTFTGIIKVASTKGTASTHSGAYTVQASDSGKLLVATAAITITFPAVSTLAPTSGDFFSCEVHNDSAGNVVLDGPGATNVTLAAGELGTVLCRNAGKMIVAKGAATVIS